MSISSRAAVYARYSSDKQSASSISDQVRKCREYAQARGWEVLQDHIYSDEAISGATSDRAGLKRLLAAAREKAFDIVLIDDTSRLSRKLVDTLNLTEQLRFSGTRLIFVSQGIDTDNEQSEVLSAIHGVVDSLFIKELAAKTRRGLEGKHLARLHTGGKVFGYRSVPIESSDRRDQYGRAAIVGAKLEIEPEQAETVRTIFRHYANGLSIKGVAKKLNHDGVRSPQPRPGRQRSWAPSSVRHILQNERYCGIICYGRTKKIRDPRTGKRVYRKKPEATWIRVENPALRIVDEALWASVRSRLAFVLRAYGDAGKKAGLLRSRLADSPYVFSGILRCAACGGSYTIVAGASGRRKYAVYGCAANAHRGTCNNSRRIGRDVLERELLGKLHASVLSPAAIDYVLHRLEIELSKKLSRIDGNCENARRKKAQLESELRNLTAAIADGLDSPSLRAGIVAREKEIAELTAKVLGSKKNSVHAQVHNLRRFVEASLADVRELLATNGNAPLVRMALQKHIDAIAIGPGDSGAIEYKGNFKLLGDDCVSWDGAEGQNRTGYAGLFRAALYR